MSGYLGIPARYATGTVTITPEQAIALTGAADADNAGRILASQYKPVSRVTKNGEVVYFKMTQTWVEAYVPYTDYRGAGNKDGDSVWVSLDPSFKELKVTKQEFEAEYTDTDLYVAEKLAEIDSNYSLDETITVYEREIIGNIDKYLPVSLPYQLISKDKTYSSVPDADKYKISVTVGWESLFSCSTTELYGKNITICYEGEESYDRELIKNYGGIDKVPAYLVNVVPVAKIGDKEYRGEWGIPLGTKQQMYTYISNKGGTSSLNDTVTSGSVYAITLDLQIISEQEAERSYNRMEEAQKNVMNTGAYSGEYLGAVLDYAGKTYFTACDAASVATELALNINRNRQMALAFTGYEMKTESYFGYVRSLHYGTFYIDVAHNNVTALSYSGNKDDEIKYMLTQGMYESSYEGDLWQTLLDDKTFGISTSSIFTVASAWALFYNNLGYYCDYLVSGSDEDAAKLLEFTINNVISFVKGLYYKKYINLGTVEVEGVELKLKDVFTLDQNLQGVVTPLLVGIDNLLQKYCGIPEHDSKKLIEVIFLLINIRNASMY